MRPLKEQTILVTGATDGLGRALALDLARRGATVLLHGRSGSRLSDTARGIREATGSARLRRLLVSRGVAGTPARPPWKVSATAKTSTRLQVESSSASVTFSPPSSSSSSLGRSFHRESENSGQHQSTLTAGGVAAEEGARQDCAGSESRSGSHGSHHDHDHTHV